MKLIEGLDDCLEDLFKYYEKDGITANSKKAKAILEEYLAYTNEDFTFNGNSLPINRVVPKLSISNFKIINTTNECHI